jgi:hypothetical protein
MKKLTMVVTTVISLATLASAVIVNDFAGKVSFDAAISEFTVVNYGYLRAGDLGEGSAVEAYIGTDLIGEVDNSVGWSINSGNAINISFDAGVGEGPGSGDLVMTIIPSSGSQGLVSTRPTDWFNAIFIGAYDYGPFLDNVELSDNTIAGQSFRNLSAAESWDGVWIDLTGYNSGNQPSFDLTSVLTPSGLIASGDDFRMEIYLMQVVPEPVSISLILVGGISILLLRRARLPMH